VLWLIAVLLAFIAGVLWRGSAGGTGGAALAQSPSLAGARGVYAFTGQIDQDQFGLFMLDIEQGTIWCYEIDKVNGTRKLKLIAARTWIYDRYLRDFNSAEPDYRMIRDLIERQREQPADVNQAAPAAAPDGRPGEKRSDGS